MNDALGGNYYAILRVDASFPIGLPEEYGVYGGLFGDIGSLWGLDDVDGSMGTVDASMHIRSAVGVSLFVDTPFAPLRFNYAVPLQREDYDEVERFRFSVRRGSDLGGRRQTGGDRPRGLPRAAAAAAPRPRRVAGSPFLFINQERLLTGSKAGQALLADEEKQRDTLRSEARALDSAFEAEERQLTDQRPTMKPEEFRSSPTPSTPASSRRGRIRTRRASSLAQEFDQRRRQFYARVAPLLVELMDRDGSAGGVRREQRPSDRSDAQHHRRGDRGDRRAGRRRGGPAPPARRAGGAGHGRRRPRATARQRRRRRRRGAAPPPLARRVGRRRGRGEGTEMAIDDRPGSAASRRRRRSSG